MCKLYSDSSFYKMTIYSFAGVNALTFAALHYCYSRFQDGEPRVIYLITKRSRTGSFTRLARLKQHSRRRRTQDHWEFNNPQTLQYAVNRGTNLSLKQVSWKLISRCGRLDSTQRAKKHKNEVWRILRGDNMPGEKINAYFSVLFKMPGGPVINLNFCKP